MKINKLLILVLSIVVAFALWLYVITIVSPESEETFNATVKLEGLQSNLMLVDQENTSVTVTIKGNRSDLAKLSDDGIVLKADLSRIVEPGTYDLSYTFVPPGDIPSGSLVVQSRNPANVSVTVERKIQDRAIPIHVEDNGTNVKGGYTVHEHKLDAETVSVSGPESVVDTIAMAKVELDLTGMDKSYGAEYAVVLCDAEGNPVDTSRLKYTEKMYVNTVIYQVKEIKLDVKIQAGGGATEETSEIVRSVEAVTVKGPADKLKQLDEMLENGVLYLGTINLAEVKEDTPAEEPLEFDILKMLPEGVSVSGDTEKLTVSIQFPELEVKEITVTQFELKNVAEGMNGQSQAKELKVSIRGPKEAMETLAPEHVKIVLDFASVKMGNSQLPAQVVITGAEFKGAGALGTYLVDVSLEKK